MKRSWKAMPRSSRAKESAILRSLAGPDWFARRALLEADYWNRFYTNSNANFNKAPNGFLIQMVEGRRAGAALDHGMGEGRNAIYLASLGWQGVGIRSGRCGGRTGSKTGEGARPDIAHRSRSRQRIRLRQGKIRSRSV